MWCCAHSDDFNYPTRHRDCLFLSAVLRVFIWAVLYLNELINVTSQRDNIWCFQEFDKLSSQHLHYGGCMQIICAWVWSLVRVNNHKKGQLTLSRLYCSGRIVMYFFLHEAIIFWLWSGHKSVVPANRAWCKPVHSNKSFGAKKN